MTTVHRFALISLGLIGCVVRTGPGPDPNNAQYAQPSPQPHDPIVAQPAQPANTVAPVTVTPAPTVTTPTVATAAVPVVAVAPVEEPPPPSDAPAEVKWNLADGRPRGMRAGAPLSYWIWQDKNGSEWHLRTTTAGTSHRFQGIVNGKTPLKDVQMINMETKDRLQVTKKSDVIFDFTTKGESDGFDFKVVGNQCVKFSLRLDGKSAPRGAVQIGASNAQPVSSHFRLCP